MPLVKLMVVDSHNPTTYRLGADVTDWDEVTDEELAFLKKYKYDLWLAMRGENPQWGYNHSLVIVEIDSIPLRNRLADLKAKLASRIAAEKVASEKRKALADARKEQKRLQKLAQEKKTLELLKAKYEATEPPGGWQGAVGGDE